MSTIKGIFEPFANYVTNQLNLRKQIVSKKTQQSIAGNTENELISEVNPLSIDGSLEGVNLRENTLFDINTRNDLFYTYTTEKQCTIRMASGVDIKSKNNILEEQEKGILEGENLAKVYILEGGIKSNVNGGPPRGGIDPGETIISAYGESIIRSNAQDGFGDVPMPGIIDAEISTKSSEGSLREASVNFVCYNKRQLEILELLYMRPGYPILLEWGWVPFIDNEGEINNNGFNILDEFFQPGSNLDNINKQIRERKKVSGGNYDGFVGFIKNFLFKAREDGGYDCSTEIIAHGEILESLKSSIKIAPKIQTAQDYIYRESEEIEKREAALEKDQYKRTSFTLSDEVETIDEFLYFLRAIKSNLDKAGYKSILTYAGTTLQRDDGRKDLGLTKKYWWDDTAFIEQRPIEEEDRLLREFTVTKRIKKYFGPDKYVDHTMWSYYQDSSGKVIPIHELNQIGFRYETGMNELLDLISDVSKIPLSDLQTDLTNYEQVPSFLKGKMENGQILKGISHPGPDDEVFFRPNAGDYVNESSDDDKRTRKYINNYFNYGGRDYDINQRNLEGLGLKPMFNNLILKEISLEQESKEDSGIRKKIFVRWDLICQILNQKVIPHYGDNNPITELTYLTKNTKTYKGGTPNKGGKFEGTGFYIPYAEEGGNTIIPLDNTGFSDDLLYRLEYSAKSLRNYPNINEASYSPGGIGDPLTQPLNATIGETVADQLKSPTTNQYSEMADDFESTFGKNTIIDFNNRQLIFPPILGRSFDRDICLMPHQLPFMTETNMFEENHFGGPVRDLLHKNFTSFKDVVAQSNSIGHVYFNLDYLISTYEQLSLEEHKTTDSLGEERTKKRLKKSFSLHDWITTIWNGVNDACAGFYDFDLHVEHERPNVARIIDFTMSGKSKDLNSPIFEFDPQGLGSIARESHFQSKLDNDFSAVISVAAQVPNDIQSLEAVSFKAFHKGIKNRFTSPDKDSRDDQIEAALEMYREDYFEYENTLRSLMVYISRMNKANYENELISNTDQDDYIQTVMSPDTAKSLASSLLEQRNNLLARYPEKDNNDNLYDGSDKVNGHYTGQYRDDLTISGSTTYNRNPIIPLESSITIDGIGGMNPLQIYKINPDKLPNGYQDPNMVFVVKKETHKITSGQDWTTQITGQISFLNDNPSTGKNPTLRIRTAEKIKADLIDRGDTEWQKWIENNPWSATFITWCVRAAEIENLDTAPGIVAVNFLKTAYRTAGHAKFFQEEVFSENQERYEHLNPQNTPLKVGDIILQGRTVKGKKGGETKYPGPYSGNSHSDIVVSIGGNVATVVGGNVGSKTPGQQFVGQDTYKLDTNNQLRPDSDSSSDPFRQPWSNGSILRSKEKMEPPINGNTGYFDKGLGKRIAEVAEREFNNWPKGKVEIDPEVEDILRKYYEEGKHKGITIKKVNTEDPIPPKD